MVERIGGIRNKIEKLNVTDPETHYAGTVPERERWYIETVSVFNDVTDNSNCLVGVIRGGTFYAVYYFKDITVDEWERQSIRAWLFSYEELAFIWSDVTADDPIKMIWHGHRRID